MRGGETTKSKKLEFNNNIIMLLLFFEIKIIKDINMLQKLTRGYEIPSFHEEPSLNIYAF